MKTAKKFMAILINVSLLLSLFLPMGGFASSKPDDREWLNEVISEEEFESAGYTERMYGLEPDMSSLIFRTVSGSFVLRSFGYPVKYLDSDGNIRDISLRIEKTQEGFRESSHPMHICFGSFLDEGYSISFNDTSVSVIPGNVPGEIAGVLSEDLKSVVYSGNGSVSYEYGISHSGVKENIILSEYTGISTFSFEIITNGLVITCAEEDVLLETLSGQCVGNIDDILVYSLDGSESRVGSISVEEIIPEQKYTVTITVPVDYLTAETTSYPVVIDPSINIQYNDPSDAGAIEDVTVYSNTSSSGSSGSLFAGLHSSYGICRTLMRFPTFDSTVTSLHLDPECIALAYVELRDVICDQTPLTVYCHRYTGNSWQESGNPSWSSLGSSFVGQLLDQREVSYGYGHQSGSGANHRYRFNITDTVRSWAGSAGEAAKGLVFKASDSFETGNTYYRKTFASYNRASYKPSLTVIYNNRYLVSTNDLACYSDTTSLQYSCNCYGYAMRLNFLLECELEQPNFHLPGEIWDKSIIPQPADGYSIIYYNGQLQNNNNLEHYYSSVLYEHDSDSYRVPQLLEFIELDCETLGVEYYGAVKYSTASQIPSATEFADRRLILLIATKFGFHFYIQNEDDSWSHKPGASAATCNCSCTPSITLTNETILDHIVEPPYSLQDGFDYSFYYVGIPAALDTYITGDSFLRDTPGNPFSTLDGAGSNTNNSKHLSAASFTGKIDFKGDIDYYSLNYKTTGYRTITINTLNSSNNQPKIFPLVLEIRDSSDTVVSTCTVSNGSGSVSYQFTANNLYYFKIYSPNQTVVDFYRQYSVQIS